MKLKTHSTVLDGIVSRVTERLRAARVSRPVGELKRRIADLPPTRGFGDALASSFGLIAEIKRKSPSQGWMLEQDTTKIALAYQDHPFVRAISVLTNKDDFEMDIDDLGKIRTYTTKPILRKDFVFDEYQVYEARAFGADAILLMGVVVTDKKLMRRLFDLANTLGLDVLFECRSEDEIKAVPTGAKIFGINSRKLNARKFLGFSRYTLAKMVRHVWSDASTQPESFTLANSIPGNVLKVAESGLSPSDILRIRRDYRYNAALVGTAILNAPQGVEAALNSFWAASKESPVSEEVVGARDTRITV
jgi:indole-3-glycerol phosphate synthase